MSVLRAGCSGSKASTDCTDQQVLWLDVSVDDVEAVEVLDGAGQVEQHAGGVSLRVLTRGGDGIKQVAPLWTEWKQHAKPSFSNLLFSPEPLKINVGEMSLRRRVGDVHDS